MTNDVACPHCQSAGEKVCLGSVQKRKSDGVQRSRWLCVDCGGKYYIGPPTKLGRPAKITENVEEE